MHRCFAYSTYVRNCAFVEQRLVLPGWLHILVRDSMLPSTLLCSYSMQYVPFTTYYCS